MPQSKTSASSETLTKETMFVGELIRAPRLAPFSPPAVTMDTVLSWMLPYVSVRRYSLVTDGPDITIEVVGMIRETGRTFWVHGQGKSIGTALCAVTDALAKEIEVISPAKNWQS